MIRLTKSQVLAMQHALIERYGGVQGIRDEGLLDSALQAPFQTFDDQDLYPSLLEKAVRLGYGVVKNHPFLDGNKRIGALILLVFLDLNGVSLEISSEELAQVFLAVASGELNAEALLQWVREKART